VMASVHFIPLHMHPYYRDTYGYVPADLPVAAGLYERILSLPFYAGMTEYQLHRVAEAVKETVMENRA
ncbi:MAG TPA: DegT/DnrJ/EryC1/StrS family aminotransferase, partial [Nitrospirota bacterium]